MFDPTPKHAYRKMLASVRQELLRSQHKLAREKNESLRLRGKLNDLRAVIENYQTTNDNQRKQIEVLKQATTRSSGKPSVADLVQKSNALRWENDDLSRRLATVHAVSDPDNDVQADFPDEYPSAPMTVNWQEREDD